MNILVGIPASGKSSAAQLIVRQGWADLVISSDETRKELTGSEEDLSRDAEVFRRLEARADAALDLGRRPIIDATHVTPSSRQPFLALSRQHHVTPVAWLVTTDFATCLHRNNVRQRHVPGDVMLRMQERFLQSTPEVLAQEGWEVVEINDWAADHSTIVERTDGQGDGKTSRQE